MKKFVNCLIAAFAFILSINIFVVCDATVSYAAGKGSLNREFAKKQIKALYPQAITAEIKKIYTPGDSVVSMSYCDEKLSEYDLKKIKETERYLDKLKEAGYITYEMNEKVKPFFGCPQYDRWYTVTFTDKIKPYLLNISENKIDVIIAKVDIDKVTGIIKDGSNRSIVEYKTKITPTPLKAYLDNNSYKPESGRVVFTLYDDGWRLER
jgi:hypothetical protein